ncbi:MAG: hypothetical protein EB039_12865, partial [Proteobacteria bacterium]|nr:hypothetical protein [Pseudomonadota bacterium]
LDALRVNRTTTRHPFADTTERSARIASATAFAALVIGLVVLRTYLAGGVQWLPPGRVALTWFWFGGTTIALVAFLAQAHGSIHLLGRCAIVGLIGAELLLAGHRMEYALGGEPGLYMNPPPVTAHALRTLASRAPDASPGRLVSLTVEQHLDATRLARWAGSTDGETVRYRAMQDALKPNLGAVYGLATIDGYDGGLLPLRTYARFKALLLPQGADPSVAHLTLGAQAAGKANASRYASLGIGAVISDGRNGSPGDNWRTNDDAPGAAWWHDNTLPPASRALLVGNVIVEPDDERAITLLATADLSNTASVRQAIQGIPERGAPDPAPIGTARVTRYLANEIIVDVSSDRAALLVMTETDYPGWHATIDGQPAPIIRANTLFRSVVVPQGTHVIRFWFAPTSIMVGIAITLSTFFALITGTCFADSGNTVALFARHAAHRVTGGSGANASGPALCQPGCSHPSHAPDRRPDRADCRHRLLARHADSTHPQQPAHMGLLLWQRLGAAAARHGAGAGGPCCTGAAAHLGRAVYRGCRCVARPETRISCPRDAGRRVRHVRA